MGGAVYVGNADAGNIQGLFDNLSFAKAYDFSKTTYTFGEKEQALPGESVSFTSKVSDISDLKDITYPAEANAYGGAVARVNSGEWSKSVTINAASDTIEVKGQATNQSNTGAEFGVLIGEHKVKTEVQTTEITTLTPDQLNGHTSANKTALDTAVKLTMPAGATDIKLVEKNKSGDVTVPFPVSGLIPSPTGLGIKYELSYNDGGVVKTISFTMIPTLSVLTKEIVIKPNEKIMQTQLNISNISGLCKTVGDVATTLLLGQDRIISSKDGVIVKLESYDPAGAITVSVDTSAATVTGKQVIQISTYSYGSNTTRKFPVTINIPQ